jgi:hypothetical protein
VYYFYEGRTIKGIGLVSWALLVQFVTIIALGITMAALGLLYGSLLSNPTALFGPFLGAVAAICGVEIAQLGMAIVFLIGFFQVHAGRHEYGLEQGRAVERALVFLIIFIVLTGISTIVSASSTLASGLIGQSTLSTLVGTLVLGSLGAFFAGLTLADTIRSVSGVAVRSRMRTAIALGVTGAAAGPVLTILAATANPITVDLITSGLVASAVAGQGISALSLFLFWLVFRETRRSLEAGTPPPVLPRIEQLYPWLYQPMYPYIPPSVLSPPPPKP